MALQLFFFFLEERVRNIRNEEQKELLFEMSVRAQTQHKDWTDIHKSYITLIILFILLSHLEGNVYRAVCEFKI